MTERRLDYNFELCVIISITIHPYLYLHIYSYIYIYISILSIYWRRTLKKRIYFLRCIRHLCALPQGLLASSACCFSSMRTQPSSASPLTGSTSDGGPYLLTSDLKVPIEVILGLCSVLIPRNAEELMTVRPMT